MRVFDRDTLDPIDPAAFGMGAALRAAVGGPAHGGPGSTGPARSSATVFNGAAARGRGGNPRGAAMRVLRGVPELFGPGGGGSGNGPSIGSPAHL